MIISILQAEYLYKIIRCVKVKIRQPMEIIMFKTIEEVIEAYKKGYIELAAELMWHENKPLGGLREANSDGRMRAMTDLYDFKRNIARTLGMSEEEIKIIDVQCEEAVQAKLVEKTKKYEEGRKAYATRC